MIHAHVALQAYSIDADATSFEFLDKFDHACTLTGLSHRIVVVVEFSIGIGLHSTLECPGDELLAQNLIEK